MFQQVPPKRLYLLQGVPGSGKSTIANILFQSFGRILPGDLKYSAIILSTDDHRYGDCGHYIFDPKTNVEFHHQTQRDCADQMRMATNYIIIDNTNILREHAYPYIALAKMYGYTVDVVRVDPGLEEAKRRNAQRPIERRVPNDVIDRMYQTMEQLL